MAPAEAGRIDHLEVLSCASSSPARLAGSAPPSSELIGAGHQVVGLAVRGLGRRLAAAGAEVQRGLDDLDILRSVAAGSDGVIHLAFKHDIAFSGGFQEASDADRRAVEALGEGWQALIDRSCWPPGPSASLRGGWDGAGRARCRSGDGPRPAVAEACTESWRSLAARRAVCGFATNTAWRYGFMASCSASRDRASRHVGDGSAGGVPARSDSRFASGLGGIDLLRR